jgi:hypothetical protein
VIFVSRAKRVVKTILYNYKAHHGTPAKLMV